MPAVLHPDFHRLLIGLLSGSQTMPQTLSLGLRTNAPSQYDSLGIAGGDGQGGVVVVSSAGGVYAPKSFPSSELSYGGGVLTVPTQTWEFVVPALYPPVGFAASHWYLFNPVTNALYASGPLGTNNVTTALTQASTLTTGVYTGYATLEARSIMTVPTADADKMGIGDYLDIGTACAGNLAALPIVSFGEPVPGGTPITVESGSLIDIYPAGTPVKQDAGMRVYGNGSVEIVNATISLQ